GYKVGLLPQISSDAIDLKSQQLKFNQSPMSSDELVLCSRLSGIQCQDRIFGSLAGKLIETAPFKCGRWYSRALFSTGLPTTSVLRHAIARYSSSIIAC